MDLESRFSAFKKKFIDKELSNQWAVKHVSNGFEIKLPNTQVVLLNPEKPEWFREHLIDPFSTKLWFQSLQYLPYLGSNQEEVAQMVRLFANYVEELETVYSSDGFSPYNSEDHAHSLQLKAACAIYCLHREVLVQIEQLEKMLLDSIEKLAKISLDPVFVKPNNHGLMLARSYLETGYLFQDLIPNADSLQEAGFDAIDFVLGMVFDSAAIANENTPGYQGLYIQIIDAIVHFGEEIGVSASRISKWEELSLVAKEKLALMTRDDGTYPALGDEPGRKSIVAPTHGELFSPENGCYFLKLDEMDLSIVCGHRGIVHKHADDTSIRLRFAGVDIFMDAGLLSYDPNDEISISISSQRGHSGCFYPRFDGMRGHDLFYSNKHSVDASIHKGIVDGCVVLKCVSILDGDFEVRRNYTILDHGLRIVDYIQNRLGEPAVRRFLLNEKARVSIEGNTVKIDLEGVRALLSFEDGAELKLCRGVIKPEPKGWRAIGHYKETACWLLEVALVPGEQGTCLVDLAKKEGLGELDYFSQGRPEHTFSVNGRECVIPEALAEEEFYELSGNGGRIRSIVPLETALRLSQGVRRNVLVALENPEVIGLAIASGFDRPVQILVEDDESGEMLSQIVRRNALDNKVAIIEEQSRAVGSYLVSGSLCTVICDAHSFEALDHLASAEDRPDFLVKAVSIGALSVFEAKYNYSVLLKFDDDWSILVPAGSDLEGSRRLHFLAAMLSYTNLKARDLEYRLGLTNQKLRELELRMNSLAEK